MCGESKGRRIKISGGREEFLGYDIDYVFSMVIEGWSDIVFIFGVGLVGLGFYVFFLENVIFVRVIM